MTLMIETAKQLLLAAKPSESAAAKRPTTKLKISMKCASKPTPFSSSCPAVSAAAVKLPSSPAAGFKATSAPAPAPSGFSTLSFTEQQELIQTKFRQDLEGRKEDLGLETYTSLKKLAHAPCYMAARDHLVRDDVEKLLGPSSRSLAGSAGDVVMADMPEAKGRGGYESDDDDDERPPVESEDDDGEEVCGGGFD